MAKLVNPHCSNETKFGIMTTFLREYRINRNKEFSVSTFAECNYSDKGERAKYERFYRCLELFSENGFFISLNTKPNKYKLNPFIKLSDDIISGKQVIDVLIPTVCRFIVASQDIEYVEVEENNYIESGIVNILTPLLNGETLFKSKAFSTFVQYFYSKRKPINFEQLTVHISANNPILLKIEKQSKKSYIFKDVLKDLELSEKGLVLHFEDSSIVIDSMDDIKEITIETDESQRELFDSLLTEIEDLNDLMDAEKKLDAFLF